ncbi:MAG TPA: hypothetical protein VLW50_18080 [Streptosporangiaceae bacterium]|nr:hypothetical protein [Streptosporangiaceae bacterium]
MTAAPYTHSRTRYQRVPALEYVARHKGGFLKFYDPDGERFAAPTYPYRWAPEGLLTVRQLRAKGLRPGGQEVAAQICGGAGNASPTCTAKTTRNRKEQRPRLSAPQ